MKLKVSVEARASFLQKETGEVLNICQEFVQECEEGSDDFNEILREYESITETKRSEADDIDSYDRKMLEYLGRVLQKTAADRILDIREVFVKQIQNPDLCCAVIYFGGWILSARDFSGVEIKALKTNISKS